MIEIRDKTIKVAGGLTEILTETLALIINLSRVEPVRNLVLSGMTNDSYHEVYNEFIPFINKVYEIMGDSDEDRDDD